MTNYYNDAESRQKIADTWDITLPKSIEILFYAIGVRSYEGEAFVLFRQGGKLYEVSDSHSPGYGFENWEPEETTAKALWHRLTEGGLGEASYCYDKPFDDELKQLAIGLDPSLGDVPNEFGESFMVSSGPHSLLVVFTPSQALQLEKDIANWKVERLAKWEGRSTS